MPAAKRFIYTASTINRIAATWLYDKGINARIRSIKKKQFLVYIFFFIKKFSYSATD
jgi:hypothetical protein